MLVTKHILHDKFLQVWFGDTEVCAYICMRGRSTAKPLRALQGPGIVLLPNPICTFPVSASHRATITHDTFNHITQCRPGTVSHGSVFTLEVKPDLLTATLSVLKGWRLFITAFREGNGMDRGINHPDIR